MTHSAKFLAQAAMSGERQRNENLWMVSVITFVFFGLSILGITFWLFRPRRPLEGETRVHRVLDGDTVIVGSGWQKTTIRLASIDCPENGQQWGNTATAGLIKLIGGKTVKVEPHCFDDYGRTVATLHVFDSNRNSWINVNTRMVAKGNAWVYRSFLDHLHPQHRNELFRLERWARDKKVGLWRQNNPIPPWVWRRLR